MKKKNQQDGNPANRIQFRHAGSQQGRNRRSHWYLGSGDRH
jgi:hypothetical protein